MIDLNKSILQPCQSSILDERNIKFFIKRDDLLHHEVSGNKWRKLKYNIKQSIQAKTEGIMTFGGAYSNHLVATAAACSSEGLKSIGIVRGDELNAESNDTLKRCVAYGMQLIFISREEYSMRNERFYQESLLLINPNFHIVPEGGANYLGMIGCQEILKELEFDTIITAQGTTTTSCGLGLALQEEQMMLVVPALKGFESLSEMSSLYRKSIISNEVIEQIESQTIVADQYHFGGYGKYDQELLNFIRDFHSKHKIKLDPIYTGKAMFAFFDQLKSGIFDNQTVIFLHTGGVQGAQSVIDKTGFELYVD